MDDAREVLKYGQDMGNTLLLTGLVASAVWLQSINPGVAPLFLITGGMITMYVKWMNKRVERGA